MIIRRDNLDFSDLHRLEPQKTRQDFLTWQETLKMYGNDEETDAYVDYYTKMYENWNEFQENLESQQNTEKDQIVQKRSTRPVVAAPAPIISPRIPPSIATKSMVVIKPSPSQTSRFSTKRPSRQKWQK